MTHSCCIALKFQSSDTSPLKTSPVVTTFANSPARLAKFTRWTVSASNSPLLNVPVASEMMKIFSCSTTPRSLAIRVDVLTQWSVTSPAMISCLMPLDRMYDSNGVLTNAEFVLLEKTVSYGEASIGWAHGWNSTPPGCLVEPGYNGESGFKDLWKTWIMVMGKLVPEVSLYLRAAERSDLMFSSNVGVERSVPKRPCDVFRPT